MRSGPNWPPLLIVPLLAAGLAAGLAVVATSIGSRAVSDDDAMLAVSPAGVVQLDDLDDELAGLYTAAADDREAFTRVTCYCGCVEFLGHRSLLECFERQDGQWERHAVGCAVCQVEAEEIIEYRDQGMRISDIVRTIDEKYGAIRA